MAAFVLRRLLFIPFTLLLVAAVTFVVLRLTGNPVDIFLDINRTPEQVAALTQRLHLDQPVSLQFLIFLRDVVHGDFGESLQFSGSAASVVGERIAATLQLAGVALALALVLGVAGGIACAVWRDRLADALISTVAVAGQSMPSFWLGLLLIQFFALQMRWLPTSGYGDLRHLVLPAATLAAILLPNFVLITRTAVLELMAEQFVTTARARGLSRARVLATHILPNAVNPILSFLGIQIGTLMAGSVITETIFAWPGVGRLLINSIFHRDVPVVEASVFFIALAIALSNLLVDMLQMLIDPRIRRGVSGPRRLFGTRFKITVGGGIVGGVVLMAVFAPLIAPWDPYQQDLMMRLKPGLWSAHPAAGHLLGTDNYGRDLLSRLIYGARLSILVGVSAMLCSALLGSMAGILAGLRGGLLEQAIMRFADAQMAFPDILLAILVTAALGGSAINLIVVLGVSRWMVYARVVFGLTRSLQQRPFVEAATLYGAGDLYIMWQHILPQVMPVLSVLATLQVAQIILQETALSFLGLGMPPPAATWGNILAEGNTRLFVAPWIANLAGLAIITLVWGINMLGNGLRERYDPFLAGR